MKKLKKALLVGSIPFALFTAVVSTTLPVGCAGTGTGLSMTDDGLVFTIAPNDINMFLKSQFPIEKDVSLGGKVILEKANVENIEDKEKVKLGVDARYDPPLLPDINAGVDVEGGIKYDPKEKTIYLKDPIVDNIRFLDRTFTIPSGLKPFISRFVSEVFGRIPLYKFSSTNLASYLIKDVKVENGKIVVKFGT